MTQQRKQPIQRSDWLPSDEQIDAYCERQRAERKRLRDRVDDGPQTILMPINKPARQRPASAGKIDDASRMPKPSLWQSREVAGAVVAFGIIAGVAVLATAAIATIIAGIIALVTLR